MKPDAKVGQVLARLAALATRVEKATAAEGASTVFAGTPSAGEAADGPRLGAVAALDTVRRRLAKLGPKLDGEVVVLGEVQGDDRRLLWTADYQMPGGGSAGEVQRSAARPSGTPRVPSLDGRYSIEARTAPVLLAYEMLITLPLELANLSQSVTDAAAAARAAVGLPGTVAVAAESEPSVSTGTVERAPEAMADTPTATRADETGGETAVAVAAVSADRAGMDTTKPAAGGRSRSVRIGLRDGSVLVADLLGGWLDYKSPLGQVEVAAADVVSLADRELRLTNGSVLRGEIVGGEVEIATRFGRHTLPAADIVEIAGVEASATK